MPNIISLTEAKEFLQISNTVSDTLITSYIDMVEAEMDAYTDRSLGLNTHTEKPKYLGSVFEQTEFVPLDTQVRSPQLFLKNYPILTIAITEGENTVTSSSYSYGSNGVVDLDTYLSEPQVVYTSGYTTVTAPNDLKLVTKLGVKSLFENNSAASQGKGDIKSKSIKEFSVSYGNGQTGYVTTIGGRLVKNYLAANSIILNRYLRISL